MNRTGWVIRSMSLYRYVPDGDELLDAVVERVVNELADDPEVQLRPVDGWRPYLSEMARERAATLWRIRMLSR